MMLETSWLQSLESLKNHYPAIPGFLRQLNKGNRIGRAIVRENYSKRFGRIPGRCVLLIFHVDRVEDVPFESPSHLRYYFSTSRQDLQQYRLWILEDLELEWIEVLGSHLQIDPLVLSEQMNTFNFTGSDHPAMIYEEPADKEQDSQTIQTRLIPSMISPSDSFTLRYFEFRRLLNPDSIQSSTNQMTFCANPRRIERWQDIDTKKFEQNWRHAFVRRCASFWSNQSTVSGSWDAVMLVDPPYDSFEWHDKKLLPACTILQDPIAHAARDKLWASRAWDKPGSVTSARDTSIPYHGGNSTLTTSTLTAASVRKIPSQVSDRRNLTSLLDEQVIHWTYLATSSEISLARSNSVNAAHYLLRSIAAMWSHQLDLIQATIAQSEYFSDDNQARVDAYTTGTEWRERLSDVANSMGDMHFLRRQMNHFESHLEINLERLGVVGGGIKVQTSDSVPRALADAQMDFAHMQTRLQPFVARAAALSHIANELATLHTSFKSVHDSEMGLTLSLVASVVFPATLIASIFSMGGEYLPGQDRFWVFWATTVPITAVLAALLLFGEQLKASAADQATRLKRWYGQNRRDNCPG